MKKYMGKIYRIDKGITLIALVVTVIVLLVLSGIVISSGMNLYDSMQRRNQIATINLIQAKIKALGEEARFSGDTSVLKGINYNDSSFPPDIKEKMNDLFNNSECNDIKHQIGEFYYLDNQALIDLNLSSVIKNMGTGYCANYYTGEIIILDGYTTKDGTSLCRLSSILGKDRITNLNISDDLLLGEVVLGVKGGDQINGWYQGETGIEQNGIINTEKRVQVYLQWSDQSGIDDSKTELWINGDKIEPIPHDLGDTNPPAITFMVNGTYNFKYIVYDKAGNSTTIEKTINICLVHSESPWNTTTHQKTCIRCGVVVEEDYTPPTLRILVDAGDPINGWYQGMIGVKQNGLTLSEKAVQVYLEWKDTGSGIAGDITKLKLNEEENYRVFYDRGNNNPPAMTWKSSYNSFGTYNLTYTIYDNAGNSATETLQLKFCQKHSDETWKTDGTNHWQECSRCGIVNKAKHTGYATQSGSTHYWTCTVCKQIYSSGNPHTWGSWADDGGNFHARFCIYCLTANEREPHDFSGGSKCSKCEATNY